MTTGLELCDFVKMAIDTPKVKMHYLGTSIEWRELKGKRLSSREFFRQIYNSSYRIHDVTAIRRFVCEKRLMVRRFVPRLISGRAIV